MKVIVIITLITSLIYSSTSHICKHDVYQKQIKHREIKASSFRQLSQIAWTPIRIQLDYTTFDSYTNISLDLRNEIKKILTQSIGILAKLLYVKRTKPIQFGQGVCWGFVKAPPDSSKGIDVDLIVFPLINRSYEDALAYAVSCENDDVTGRPNIGMITFIEKQMDFSRSGYHESYVNIALHELYHVLGFSAAFFSSFVDENGVKLPLDKVVKTQVINGVTKSFIITPKVVQAAKKHFNCDNVIGVELENQGGSGTAGSHWEGRVMNGDFMTGGLYHDISISEITLALLEDSGLYKVNYYTGGLFRFGKNKGCSFLSKPCLINMRSNFPNEFCDKDNEMKCTFSFRGRGVCFIYQHETIIPEQFQYFPRKPRHGGSHLHDYCPVLLNFRNGYDSMSCVAGKKLDDFIDTGETFTTSSMCFMSNIFKKEDQIVSTHPLCYETECDYANNILKVKYFKTTANCPSEGGIVNSAEEELSGSVLCPQFNMVCTNKEKCHSVSDCVNKQSIALDSTFDYLNKNNK